MLYKTKKKKNENNKINFTLGSGIDIYSPKIIIIIIIFPLVQ